MRLLVDEMPEKKRECIFHRFNGVCRLSDCQCDWEQEDGHITCSVLMPFENYFYKKEMEEL